jgi:hypothetical protein
MHVMVQAIVLVVVQIMLLALSPFIVGLIRKVKAGCSAAAGAEPLPALCRSSQAVPQAAGALLDHILDFYCGAVHRVRLDRGGGPVDARVPLAHAAQFRGQHHCARLSPGAGDLFPDPGGLDAGSAFGGMGSSREAIVATLAEPAMMLSILWPSR